MLADFSFWDFFWDMLLIMAWVIWFWLLITVFADLFAVTTPRGSPRSPGLCS